MSSLFVKMLKKQMRRGKTEIFDFEDLEAVTKFREMLEKMFSIMKQAGSVEIEQLQTGGVPAEKHTLKKPKVSEPMTMLHLHGGGFFSGNAGMYRAFVSNLCVKLQVNAYSISYRLIPEYPFPAALDDAYSSYKWLLENTQQKAEKIFLLGDSVGGGLVLSLLQRIKKNNLPLPRCAVCISPWTDLTLSNTSYVTNREADDFFNFANLDNSAKLYIGNGTAENPEISPIFADFTGFPPVFLQVASTEMLLDDSLVIAERMKEKGVAVNLDIWEGLFHDFPIFGNMPVIGSLAPEFKKAVNNIKSFIDNT